VTAYLVAYDLVDPDEDDYERLIEHLKTYPNWAHVQKSVWVLVSSMSASTVREDIRRFIDMNDKLFVLKSGREAAWWPPGTELDGWLEANL
jgi:hypothetical protein